MGRPSDFRRHPVRAAARSAAAQTRDLRANVEEIPVLRRITACCAAPGMTIGFVEVAV